MSSTCCQSTSWRVDKLIAQLTILLKKQLVNLFFLQTQEYSFEQVFNLQYLNFKAYEIPDKGDFLLILYCKKYLQMPWYMCIRKYLKQYRFTIYLILSAALTSFSSAIIPARANR